MMSSAGMKQRIYLTFLSPMQTHGFTQLYNNLSSQVLNCIFWAPDSTYNGESHMLTDILQEKDAIKLLLIQKAI